MKAGLKKLGKKGISVIAAIMGCVVASIFLLMAIFVTSQVISAIPTPTGEMATAFNETVGGINAGLQLGAVLPIIMFASVVLLGIVIYFYPRQ